MSEPKVTSMNCEPERLLALIEILNLLNESIAKKMPLEVVLIATVS
jgi:hypothetical protein